MKQFYIKLVSVTIAVILVINVFYNLILADQLAGLKNILSLSNNEVRRDLRGKIRNELKSSLEKENILNEEDKIILIKLYNKLKKEFETINISDK
jgi:hypothetical protein|tara:strand:- start:693 stop:977 length:285 start_codon:yes stop_codon:yes gene_type:complete